jgi:hypothetical protein
MRSLIPQFASRYLDSYQLFRLQLREQDHVADAFLAEQHQAQAVNADGWMLSFPMNDIFHFLGSGSSRF